jgi:hypothetical protein
MDENGQMAAERFHDGSTAKTRLIVLGHFLVNKPVPQRTGTVTTKRDTKSMNHSHWRNLLTTAILTASLSALVELNAAEPELAPLPLKLPLPTLKGTPEELPKGANIEPIPDKPRAPFLAPKGVTNLALGKKVTSSDKNPFVGQYSQITDGKKEALDSDVVEMRKGVQWVQVDLGEPCDIHAVVVWHDHRLIQAFRSVVVQAADDPDFIDNVTTLFNNDTENQAGQGIGLDKQYFETQEGKLLTIKNGLKTRYLRFYTRGSNSSALNCYQEIEVYGFPARKK